MLEFPTICRFCTKKTKLIYDLDDKNNSSLIEKLATLAPNTIELNEILPQKICQNCHDKLNETYTFQQQIYQTFTLYKRFMEYQENSENAEEGAKAEPFEYRDEDFISEDLRHFINNLGNCTAQVNETFIRCVNNNLPDVKVNSKKSAARKQPEATVKRKRGRPRKYCGLLELKNDDLTDVEKMKDAVVNSLPNIDPDYEPRPYYEQPVINLRKKRGRPKSAGREVKDNKRRMNETFIITEQVHQVYDVPQIEMEAAGTSNEDANATPTTTKVCGFAAKSQEYLNRHMLRHDDNDDNKIECTICKKLLKTRNSLKIHMKRHKDERSSETPYWRKAV